MSFLTPAYTTYGVSAALDAAATIAGTALLTSLNPLTGVILAPVHTAITGAALFALSKTVNEETFTKYKTAFVAGAAILSALVTTALAAGAFLVLGIPFSFVTLAVIALSLTVSSLAFTAFHYFVQGDLVSCQEKAQEAPKISSPPPQQTPPSATEERDEVLEQMKKHQEALQRDIDRPVPRDPFET